MSNLNHPMLAWAMARATQLLALGGMLAALTACGIGSSAAGANPASSPSPATSFGVPVATNRVLISNYAFVDQAITVKVGTQVTWANKDADTHTVTFDADGKGSADLQDGQSYKQTFNTVGTFKYHCTLHPYMVGEVVVTAA